MMRRRKQNAKSKPLPPSKRLRLEAQRVLKQRVQDIADKKGIKLRFCNLKECESHIHTIDSSCANIRMEIGWPPGVPFVHPHDLPNKAKLAFLEAYEPGWTLAQHNPDRLVNTRLILIVTLFLRVPCHYDHAQHEADVFISLHLHTYTFTSGESWTFSCISIKATGESRNSGQVCKLKDENK